jgi:uncharacterized protein (TIGR00730 family)
MKKERKDTEETIEQSHETAQAMHNLTREDLSGVQKMAEKLISELVDMPDGDLVGEIIDNSLKLLRDRTNRGDIKLINKSLKELRYALKVFAPYRDVRKVSIFGSARTLESHSDYEQAVAFSKAMAAAGWMVITGAGGGIMAAGHGGAGADPSFGLAIRLPNEQKANVYIANDPKLINFKYFFTRKLMFLRASHAIALFPGGFGTMDEGFEVLTLVQTGKSVPVPIVFVDSPGGDYWKSWNDYVENQLLARRLISPNDRALYKITDNVEDAVEEVQRFYRNYHSLRFWKDQIILRLHQSPTGHQFNEIAREFADLSVKNDFRLSGPLPIERDEPTLSHLHRLVFSFNRKDHGRLRMLIDRLNELV